MVQVGDVIDGVRLDRLAVRGPASTIFQGTHLASGEPKAVKLLTASNESAQRRLRREADLLREINHPNVVPFHGCVDHGGDLALITDWVHGASLLALVRGGKTFSVDETLRLAASVAAALDYLHERNIVHRDVSPANIMMGSSGDPVLIDLGIGHDVNQATMTNHDLVAGTPKYLAPEIIRGEAATGRADQYSLAVVIYELLTGASPFPGDQVVATALHHQVNTQPASLIEHKPDTPVPLSRAVAKALEKDPRRRHDSAAAFITAARQVESPKSRLVPVLVASAFVAAVVSVILGVWGGEAEPGETASPAPAIDLTVAEDVDLETSNPAWPIGSAATTACNQLTGSIFENGSVPLDFFGDPPGRERVVPDGGYGGSWALEVGQPNNYGQYGETVPVVAGQDYVFSGWLSIVEPVADAQLGIALLDASYAGLDISVVTPVVETGFVRARIDAVPPEAAFAIPFLFKDASPGVLIADELVFGTQQDCGVAMATVYGS